MASRGCEVHSFDPTGNSMEVHEKHQHPSGNVHFHPWGLSAEVPRKCAADGGADGGARPAARMHELEARRFSGGTYGNLTGPLFSLDRIVRKLGHTNRRISLLKVDCEGCEWDAFHHLATRASSANVLKMVDAIYLELHLGLQMSTSDDLIKWASMYHLLFEVEGFTMWWVHPNAARAPGAKMHKELHKLPYSRSVWEPGPAPLAWEIGMRRLGTGGEGIAACPKRHGRG